MYEVDPFIHDEINAVKNAPPEQREIIVNTSSTAAAPKNHNTADTWTSRQIKEKHLDFRVGGLVPFNGETILRNSKPGSIKANVRCLAVRHQ